MDDREDYMETKPRRPQTFDDLETTRIVSGSFPIELNSIRTTQNDPETTGNGRKDYMETIGTCKLVVYLYCFRKNIV